MDYRAIGKSRNNKIFTDQELLDLILATTHVRDYFRGRGDADIITHNLNRDIDQFADMIERRRTKT
jgi:hypothetical protein